MRVVGGQWSVVSKFPIALCAMVFALSSSASAQQPAKVSRIGFLSVTSPSAIAARAAAFRRGLRELGYMEGKNIIVEWRYAEGKLDRAGELAAELGPGGNITGLSTLFPEISGKRLELLKEPVPNLSRVGVLVPQIARAIFRSSARSNSPQKI